MHIREFEPDDTDAVVALWEAAGLTRSWNDPHRDIERKLQVQPELFLVAEGVTGKNEHAIIGTVMAGYDGHRGWMNYLASSLDARGIGVGRALVEYVEAALFARGCPKVNLQVRSTNAQVVEFYRHLGYEVDDVLSLGKRLIED
ncbi:GNAT family acetyltransferase [Leucobacter sp. cx-42]|uniref:GNAT family acetyltransferase n=1 Tax=unclassified Leucobacter TaxID=2621730 RepID=UPI00165E3E9D|nr:MULTISPECIES: GNAT family acetyltransferase [unclassified Leucobacter]MBC9953809.1 GNAT family acetyltransferase [Leucobacter sp. cx-42]